MKDDVLLKMSNDPEKYWEDGVLYGPGFGDRVALISVSREAVKDYAGPVPRWVTRRGLKLWDVVANQYDPTQPAMVVTPDGFRSVDSSGVYTWGDVMADYREDLDEFFDALVKFDRS